MDWIYLQNQYTASFSARNSIAMNSYLSHGSVES